MHQDTIFTDEFIFGIILSTFSLENGITVPGNANKKYDNFLEVNAINIGHIFSSRRFLRADL